MLTRALAALFGCACSSGGPAPVARAVVDAGARAGAAACMSLGTRHLLIQLFFGGPLSVSGPWRHSNSHCVTRALWRHGARDMAIFSSHFLFHVTNFVFSYC